MESPGPCSAAEAEIVVATGDVYNGQGRNQCDLMNRVNEEFLVED